ncbi:MAG: hypothetical protein U0269_19520 [Polyangiales bacterium]
MKYEQLPIAGELPSCGELYNLRVVDNTLYADSSFGVERFRIEATGVRRWPDHVFASALEDDEPEAKWTVKVNARECSLKQGKPDGGNADCVLKTTADIFTRIVRENYTPGASEFMAGLIKSNDVALLETFQKAFGLG